MSLFRMWKLWSTLQHAPNSTPKSQKQNRSGRQEVITYNTTDSLGRKPVTLNSLISDTPAFKPWLSWQRSQTSWVQTVRVWTHTYQKLSCRSLTSDLQLETQITAFVNADDNVITRITGTPTILSPHPSSWALISHRGPSCSLRLDPGKPCSREQWRQCHWSLFKHSSWSHSW